MKSHPLLLLSFCLARPRRYRMVAAACFCLLALAAPVVAGQWDDERAAESRGDWVAAFKMLGPLAEQGDAGAQGELGVFYELGRGVAIDYVQAAKWLRQSAEQGNAVSQNNLAGLYILGRGVPLDKGEGLKWHLKSAAQRFYGAYENLGNIYRLGDGVPVDFIQAYMWYRLASNSATTPSSQTVRQNANAHLTYLASKMTPEDVAEAERRARDWKP